MSRRTITFHYTLRTTEGRLLDTSRGGAPITYVEGDGTIIDGLEEALRDLAAGTKTRVMVTAARGYGERDEHLVQRVKRRTVPVAEINVGDRFQTGPDRHAPIVTVVGLEGDDVVLDANHPFAGVDLDFEVEVVAVRPTPPTGADEAAEPDQGRV